MKFNFKLIFLSIILLGAILRITEIGHYNKWIDEVVSVLGASGQYNPDTIRIGSFTNLDLKNDNDLKGVLRSTIFYDSGNGIIYNIALHYWLRMFGNSIGSARLLSCLFGILLIPLVFIFSQKLFGNFKFSLVIVLLIALHPLLIEYSRLARPYAISTFFALLSSIIFFNILKGSSGVRIFIMYSLIVVVTLLTHYLSVVVFIAHGIMFLSQSNNRKSWLGYLLSLGFIAVVVLVWLLTAGLEGFEYMQVRNQKYVLYAASWKPGDDMYYIPATFGNIFTCVIQNLLSILGNNLQNAGLRIREIILLLFIPVSLIFTGFMMNWKNLFIRNNLLFLILLVFIQILFAVILAVRTGHCISMQAAYANFICPYAMVMLGFSIHSIYTKVVRKKLVVIAAAFILIIMSASLVPMYTNFARKFPDKDIYGEMANEIKSHYHPGDTILFNSLSTAIHVTLDLPDDVLIYMKLEEKLELGYSIDKGGF